MSEYVGIPKDSDALEHYGTKGAKWGYNKGKRNGKRTASSSSVKILEGDKQVSRMSQSEVTAEAIKSQVKKPGSANVQRTIGQMQRNALNNYTSGRASRAMIKEANSITKKLRNAANTAVKAVGRARAAKGNDAADIRAARAKARQADADNARKKKNRQLNRIDGLNAKQGLAARRQIASYYNRRNRKNLKNA